MQNLPQHFRRKFITMQNIIITLFFLFSVYTPSAWSQSSNFILKKGTPYSKSATSGFDKYYSYIDETLFSVKTYGNSYTIQKYNPNDYSVVIENEERIDKDEYIIGKLLLGGHDYYFNMNVDRLGRNGEIYAQKINPQTAQFGEKILLHKEPGSLEKYFSTRLDKLIRTNFASGKTQEINIASAKILGSIDGSKAAIHLVKSQDSKREQKENTEFTWILFDEDLNKIWQKDILYPYTEKRISEAQYHLSNNGDIYTIVRVNGDRPVFSKDDYEIQIFKIDGRTQELSHREIVAPFQLINSLELTEDKSGNVYLVGGYDDNFDENKRSLQRSKNTVEGFFSAKIEDDLSLTFKKYNIPQSLITEYTKVPRKVRAGKVDAKMSNMQIRDVDFNSDGSFTMFIENYIVITKVDRETGIVYYMYYGGNIYGIGADKNADLIWVNKIPKYQYSSIEYGGVGYFYTSDENASYLIFGDHKKNKVLPKDKATERYFNGNPKGNGVIDLVKIDKESGNIKREAIMPLKKIDRKFANRRFGLFRYFKLNNANFGFEALEKNQEIIYRVLLN